MKVAIYCRVSTEEQDASKQEFICKEFCKHRDFDIYGVYKDVMSGSKTQRPAFNRLLSDMRNMEFKAIMVTKFDRIGRSLAHLLSLLDEFNSKGIHFIAVTQNIDTTTMAGRMTFQILGAISEFERNLISERTKEGMLRAKNVGKRGKDKKPRKRRGGTKSTIFEPRQRITKDGRF